jgi:L-amino acid N-acyltransferase YncA
VRRAVRGVRTNVPSECVANPGDGLVLCLLRVSARLNTVQEPAQSSDAFVIPMLIVRDVIPADAESIVGILTPIIEARIYTVFDTPFSVDAERDYIVKFASRGVWKVAHEPDGRVVGFQVLEPFATYTKAFDHVGTLGTYVALGQRRQGIAKALFAATLEAARQKGYEKIFTFVRADNPAALATYQAQGFAVIGTARRHAKIGGRYVDEILIEKHLDR